MSFSYLPLYTGDYLRDTRHLSMCEHGAYLLALTHCWDSKGPMPLDERKQFAIVCARSTDEMEAWRRVRNEFFVLMEDGWYQPRMAREIERCEAISAARSGAGRVGANARMQALRERQANAKQMPSNCLASAEHVTLSPSPSPVVNTSNADALLVLDGAEHRQTASQLDCPHGEILALWAEVLPSLPQHDPALWRGARSDHLRARWRETAASRGWKTRDEGLAYFRRLFSYVGASAFLTGRVSSRDRRPFVCELEWLVKPTNWAKVHEGKYHMEASV